MQNKVFINGLRLYAYHGVMKQEQKIGSYFIIDAEFGTDFSDAIKTDNLCDTVSYADLFSIIQREMAVPSKLLEHVAGRIARAIQTEYPSVQNLRLRIIKENPPMGADCRGAGVELCLP